MERRTEKVSRARHFQEALLRQDTGEAKITELDLCTGPFLHQENILWLESDTRMTRRFESDELSNLDIKMNNVILMKVRDGLEQLLCHVRRLRLSQATLQFQCELQIALLGTAKWTRGVNG